jgi:predicted nuclease with TOPRIM domain
MFGLRAYIMVAVIVAVSGAVMSARAYYKETQERIATLHKNNAKMEVVQQQNEVVMRSLTSEATRLNELNFDLQGKLDSAEDYKNELIGKLQKHDLTRLSYLKPGLIEKRINNGTQKVFDSLESLTSISSE